MVTTLYFGFLKFVKKIKERLMVLLKKLSPKSLLARSLLILITPLLLVQVVLGHMFFDRHTKAILELLSTNIAGEISLALEWMESNRDISKIQKLAQKNLDISISVLPKSKLDRSGIFKKQYLYEHLRIALDEKLKRPYFVNITTDDIFIQVESKYGVLECKMNKRKLFSRTIPLVLLWTTVSAFLLFLVASMFMRNQIRPIIRLAKAAEHFGRGDNSIDFIPEGAKEVRQAGIAFLMMRERLMKLLQDRMQMLAEVSHDLRTPLTRIKLQLSMMEKNDEINLMQNDIKQMQGMIDGYLAYSRGTLIEKNMLVNLGDELRKVCSKYHSKDFLIKIDCPSAIKISLKVETFNRLLTNLVVNSTLYSTCLNVHVQLLGHFVEIILDDNGPGIPEDERENVFKPFYRLDAARSQSGANVGLGLSIVRDGIRTHGGQIALKASPLGGVRVLIKLPV
ncbi:MAG: two-component sensor histidine kinase [Proteobacteria bacterium]|nr:two-component sensor histidine kinase [Pseudomonadota bacterium]